MVSLLEELVPIPLEEFNFFLIFFLVPSSLTSYTTAFFLDSAVETFTLAALAVVLAVALPAANSDSNLRAEWKSCSYIGF